LLSSTHSPPLALSLSPPPFFNPFQPSLTFIIFVRF
jgi:hypothetical protein